MSARVIAGWILSVALCLLFLFSAFPKLQGSEQIAQHFEEFGYPPWFATFTGVLETLGAILVLIPAAAAYGAVLLAVIMVGAAYTHISTGIGSPLVAIIVLVASVVLAYLRTPSAWRPGPKA